MKLKINRFNLDKKKYSFMSEFQKEGKKIIDNLVSSWSQKYSHLTTFLEKNDNTYKFLFY